MQKIKIPLILKTPVYLLFFILFLILIIFPANFLSIFTFHYIITFLLTIFGFILFFYVLKNNTLSIKLFSVFLFLNFIVINFISVFIFEFKLLEENALYIIYFIFLTLLLIQFYLLNKRIKKGIDNLELKYITEKQQHKTFIFTFLIYTILLLVFRFSYYNTENEIENYEDFFVSKYQNIDIKEEDNLFYDLKKISEIKYNENLKLEKIEIIDCIYFDKCLRTLNQYKDFVTKIRDGEKVEDRFTYMKEKGILKEEFDNEIEKDKLFSKIYLIKNIDLLYSFDNNFNFELLSDLGNKKYFRTDINNFQTYTNYIGITRDLKYKILYYLNNNQEEKAIELLSSNLSISYSILSGDASLIESLVAITTLNIGYGTIDLLINNFELKTESKNKLILILNKEIKKEFLDNGLIIDHIFALKSLEDFNNELKNNGFNISIYDYKYTKKGFDEIRYDIIINEGKISEDIEKKYSKLIFFKKNIIGQIMLNTNLNFESQYNKLFELNEYRLELLEKVK